MLRLVAFVTLKPDVDPTEPMRLLREMATAEPNALTAEVGLCQPSAPGRPPVATYVYTATFADRASFERYATGIPHDEVQAKVDPMMESCVSTVFTVETEQPPDERTGRG